MPCQLLLSIVLLSKQMLVEAAYHEVLIWWADMKRNTFPTIWNPTHLRLSRKAKIGTRSQKNLTKEGRTDTKSPGNRLLNYLQKSK